MAPTHTARPCRFRNDASMLAMTPAAQFTWLHRFYLVLDRVAQQHKVRAAGKVCSLGCRWDRPYRKDKLPSGWPHLNHLNLSPSCFQVYKLYGGSHGFMLSTGVAEADPTHATTLLRCALHLLRVFEPVSGMAHRDPCVPACRRTAGPPDSPPPPPPPPPPLYCRRSACRTDSPLMS